MYHTPLDLAPEARGNSISRGQLGRGRRSAVDGFYWIEIQGCCRYGVRGEEIGIEGRVTHSEPAALCAELPSTLGAEGVNVQRRHGWILRWGIQIQTRWVGLGCCLVAIHSGRRWTTVYWRAIEGEWASLVSSFRQFCVPTARVLFRQLFFVCRFPFFPFCFLGCEEGGGGQQPRLIPRVEFDTTEFDSCYYLASHERTADMGPLHTVVARAESFVFRIRSAPIPESNPLLAMASGVDLNASQPQPQPQSFVFFVFIFESRELVVEEECTRDYMYMDGGCIGTQQKQKQKQKRKQKPAAPCAKFVFPPHPRTEPRLFWRKIDNCSAFRNVIDILYYMCLYPTEEGLQPQGGRLREQNELAFVGRRTERRADESEERVYASG
ncbi:hypothetical protein DFH07DRAFT_940167 [Mycena maculata]|uniref:Uncharacterized protein n=1 Tax=Mycena maculata TaxID=230809 RepID=A0AAD7NG32_9AGAR|nr:hypothetical protein DFH07DRAFT_940167 [Mycena maculata]